METTLKTIVGFTNYAVSEHGDVYRITRAKAGRSANPSRIPYRLRPIPNGRKQHRFLSVRIRGNDGIYALVPIHKLVITAFSELPPSEPGAHYEIVHLDKNRMNNRVENLAWVRRSDNPNRPQPQPPTAVPTSDALDERVRNAA